MSLNGALNASVSGLRAQSAAVAAVSENIANASTTAYKTREISFQSLVTGNQTGTGFSSGGVIFSAYQDLGQQGQIQAYDSSTFIAINGNGFFVVTDEVTNQPSGYTYTRNGSFSTDAAGFLVNSEGY
ncbi:MAG: flagellar hook basal-body protein, partial [Alphaproteobacteria bacterium]|nr:flagellar hook basal-body protein [Alphaproteobacteria bacterium]